MASEHDGGAAQTDGEPIALEMVETFLCCPRRYQYEHEQEIRTRTTQDAIDDRTELYREVITATLAECRRGEVTTEALHETAESNLHGRLDGASESDARSRAVDSNHRRYDEASVRNAVANYVDDYGEAHAEGAIAIDETYTYATGGYTFECPVDCVRTDGDTYEIARFVTTLDGIVWENPYSDPVAGYRDQEEFYPRQVGSILRAYATIHAVAAAHGIDVHNVHFRYYAIAEETYPNYEENGRENRAVDGRKNRTGNGRENQAENGQGNRAGPEVIAARRDVTESCWEADEACPAVLADAASGITDDDGWTPTGDRWTDIVARSCRYCKYQSMCLDHINEEVRF